MYPAAPSLPATDPTAVVGRRFGAAIIDFLIVVIGVGILSFAANHDSVERDDLLGLSCSDVRDAGGTNLCVEVGDNLWYAEDGKAAAIYTIIGLAWLANHVLLQGATGASIGKHIVGLRVVKKDTGQRASVGANFIRELVGIVDHLCCFLPGLIMILTVKGHRRLGDMAASTLVVGTESVGIPPVVPGLTTPQFTGSPYATAYPPSPMSPPMPASPTGWSSKPPPAAPPSPTGWASPSPDTPPASEPAREAGATPAANTPTWDPQRNTYVIFDATQNQWMQWDAASQQWRPIA
jgi:uncharacterized RDD family membrane protein YckC